MLLSNDCVIVPGFGGFVAHHVDACYSEEEHEYVPPMRAVGFNPMLKLNDSLLVQSYIAAYDMGYPEALKRIEGEVAELRSRIDIDGHYDFCGVGRLSIDSEGKYNFEPCAAGLLTPSLYGLSTFDIVPMKSSSVSVVVEVGQTAEDTVAESSNSDKSESPALAVPAVGEETVDDESADNTAVCIPLNVLRNVAAACIAVLVLFLMPKPVSDDGMSLNRGGVDTNFLYSIMPKGVTTNKPDLGNVKKELATEAKKVASDTLAAAPKKVVEKDVAKNFTIVLASKVSRKNAISYVKRLHDSGLAAADTLFKPHNNRVVYGRYATRDEALKVRNTLNDNVEFADSWVMNIERGS